MNKQRRKNRGQPANGTVPGPGPGPTSPWALLFLDVRGSTPASASGRGSRTWGGGDPAHPAPRAQDLGPEKKTDATRGQVGHSPYPDALHHPRRCARPAPGKAGRRGGRPAGLGAAGRGPRRGRPRGRRRGCGGFPPVTSGVVSTRLPPPRSASPSGAQAQAHVWFCFSEGEGAP